jgi:hemoglobin/transferrin/lactoferrin receptor protein
MSKFHLILILSLSQNSILFAQSNSTAFKLDDVKYVNEYSEIESEDKDLVDSVNVEEIKQSNVSSIDDVVRLTPGATTSRGPRSSGESVQVRGLDTHKVFIYIDGVKQNYKAGHTSMITTDVENLVSAKIHKSSSDFSKSGSLGGGISFRTVMPSDIVQKNSKTNSAIKYQNNSANTENIYNIKTAYKDSRQQALISYSKKKSFDLNLSDDSELENSSYEENNFLGKLFYKKFNINFENFERKDSSPLDPSLNPPDRIQSLLADNIITKKTISLNYKTQKTNLVAYQNIQQIKKKNREEAIVASRSIKTVGVSFKRKLDKWSFGGDSVTDTLRSDKNGEQIVSYPNASRVLNSAFVEKSFNYKNLGVTPGLKLQAYKLQAEDKNFDSLENASLTKKIESKYIINNNSFLYAHLVESVNAPNVGEVFPSGLHSKGDDFFIRDNFFKPNLNLKQEYSEQVEIGYSVKFKGFNDYDQFKITHSYYENKIKDYIYMERVDRSTLDDEDGSTQYVNIPKVKLQGQEISLSYIADRIEFDLAFATVRGENESLGLYLEDLPADFYTVNLRYFNEQNGFNLGYLGLITQEQNRVNADTIQRTDKSTGYFIHNVFVSKSLGKYVDVNLRVDNLGNKKYRRHGSHLYESREDYKLAINIKL